MSERKHRVMIGVFLILGVCLGTSIGLWMAPGGDTLEPILSSTMRGAAIGSFIGGGIGIVFSLMRIVKWTTRRSRIVFILMTVLAIGLGFFLYLTHRRVPVECEQIQERELRALLKSGPVALDEAKRRLNSSSFKGVEISGLDYGDGTKTAAWIKDEIGYYVRFRNDILVKVNVTWISPTKVALEPVGEEILTCFGTPDLYQAVDDIDPGGTYIALSLWYLEKGIVVQSEQLRYGNQLPTIDGNMIMDYMTIVPPGTAEEMIRNVYNFGYLDDVHANVLKSLKPWPGSWEEVVITGCSLNLKECSSLGQRIGTAR